ncbi:MAG: ABC transporter permease [Bacteroidetes bacterium]|nr:ABC transporter permease [Bacteroidota bacterium]
MSKIRLITWREYITRVRKRSFIIMTILGPLLIALFYGILIFFIVNEDISRDLEQIYVSDPADHLHGNIEGDDYLLFEYGKEDPLPDDTIIARGYSGQLIIPANMEISDPKGIVYRSREALSMQTKEKLNRSIAKEIKDQKMIHLGISESKLDSLNTRVEVTAQVIGEDGEARNASTEISTGIGMALSLVIYMFIFMYGVQVMRGVIEEKTNRIVEVIVSSVKPFELMMGKVFGLAMVGLTQILIWVILTSLLMLVISSFFLGDMGSISEMMKTYSEMTPAQMEGLSNQEVMLSGLFNLNFKFIVGAFILYFIGGYLMYSALFAAVGAAVDAETDTQQFMLPITMPLIFSIVLSTSVVMRDPNGTLSFWLSIIPVSSPVVMMVRAPFINLHEQWWEVLLSAGILIASFCFTIWLAGRIYRTGILMYGKKATYKELFKWLFYKP